LPHFSVPRTKIPKKHTITKTAFYASGINFVPGTKLIPPHSKYGLRNFQVNGRPRSQIVVFLSPLTIIDALMPESKPKKYITQVFEMWFF